MKVEIIAWQTENHNGGTLKTSYIYYFDNATFATFKEARAWCHKNISKNGKHFKLRKLDRFFKKTNKRKRGN